MENISNTFRQDYMDDSWERINEQALSFVVSKLCKFNPKIGTGKSFGYFSLVTKNWFIQTNNDNYNHLMKHESIELPRYEYDEEIKTIELIAPEKQSPEHKEFVDLMLGWFDEHLDNVIQRENTSYKYSSINKTIAKQYLQCFREYPDSILEGPYVHSHNRIICKHICKILGKEYTPEMSKIIHRAIIKLQPHIYKLYKNYLETGEIEKKPIYGRRIYWDEKGVKHVETA